MKKVLKIKDLFCAAIVVFVIFGAASCKPKADPLKIDGDCEYLAKILPEASVDVSQTIDEGLNLDEVMADIKAEYAKNLKKYFWRLKLNESGIDENLFAYSIKEVFKNKLTRPNSHLSFSTNSVSYSPYLCYLISFSDLYFEKSGSDYIVYDSDDKHVKAGMVYSGDESQLYKTIKDGKLLYRFGAEADHLIKKAEINVDGKKYTVPVNHPIHELDDKPNLTCEIDGKTMYVKFDSCSWHTEAEGNRLEEAAKQIGKTIKEQPLDYIIFDLRNNSGGLTSLPNEIIFSLIYGEENYENVDEFEWYNAYLEDNELVINTLTTRNRTGMQGWGDTDRNRYLMTRADEKYVKISGEEGEYAEDFIKEVSPIYNGKIIVIMNEFTASATEHFIAYLKVVFKDRVICVGQRTFGCYDYGNVYLYRLPDSKIAVLLSQSDYTQIPLLQNSGWQGDTVGFVPDYYFAFDDDFNITNITEQIELFF